MYGGVRGNGETIVSHSLLDYRYCDKYYYEYKFNKDGKCDYYPTFYNFPDASKYEYVNERIESRKTVWNTDSSGFYFASTYITTMTPKKTLTNMDHNYYPYIIRTTVYPQ